MGGFAEKEIRVRETPLRQSPSQKSEISDSPLYTRGPLDGAQINSPINWNFVALLDFVGK